MKGNQMKKDIYLFILIYCISRVFILFIPASLIDQAKIYDLQSFPNLLSFTTLNPVYPYPILFSLQFSTIFWLFGANMVGYRIGTMLYEVGSIIVLYKFVFLFRIREFQKTIPEANRAAISSCCILAFSPFTIFIYAGNSEFPALFYMLLGLYLYYKDKVALGALILCIGFLTEFFPIFCLVPILINSLLKKKWKNILKIIISFLILFVPINLPFFLANPTSFLPSYSSQLSRTNSVSLWTIFPGTLPEWNILSIQLGFTDLIFLSFFIGYCCFTIFYFFKHKSASKRQEFIFIILFALILPVVFLSLISFYFFFGIPLFCLFIEPRISIEKERLFGYLITVILIPFSIINLTFWPQVYLTTPTLEGFSEGMDAYSYYLILTCFYTIIAIIWVKSSNQWDIFKRREKNPTILRLLILVFLIFIALFSLAFIFRNNILSIPIAAVLILAGLIICLWVAKKTFAGVSRIGLFEEHNSQE